LKELLFVGASCEGDYNRQILEALSANTSLCHFMQSYSIGYDMKNILRRNSHLNFIITSQDLILSKKQFRVNPLFWKLDKPSCFKTTHLSYPGEDYDLFCDNLRCFIGLLLKACKYETLDKKLNIRAMNDNSAVVLKSTLNIIQAAMMENSIGNLVLAEKDISTIREIFTEEPNLILFIIRKLADVFRTIGDSYTTSVFDDSVKVMLCFVFDLKSLKQVIKNMEKIQMSLETIKKACVDKDITMSEASETSNQSTSVL
jgi:hypothetical protein